MAKTINVKQVLSDIKSGVSDALLMEKYGLSPKGLESLFKKLVEAKLISSAELKRQPSPTSTGAAPSPRESRPRSPEPTSESGLDPKLVSTAVAFIQQGRHDNELMRELGLSPGELKKLKEDLVRLGYVEAQLAEQAPQPAPQMKQCPSCGREMAEGESYCRYCGHGSMEPSPGMAGAGFGRVVPETASEESYDDKSCEWEDNRGEGTLRAFFQTASRCLITPTDFFSNLPLDSGYWSPLLFAVMAGVFGGVLGVLWYHLLSGGSGGFAILQIVFIMSLGFIGALIIMPLFLFIYSGIVHGLLLLFGGAGGGFQATFRVASYSSVTALFKAIPVVGSLVSLWGVYLAVVGLRETHGTSTGKAAGAVLVPVVVPIVLSTMLFGMWWLPWGGKPKAAKIRVQAPVSITGEPFPSEVCSAIDGFLGQMDSISAEGVQDAGQQIKAAMSELEEGLKGFESDPRSNQIRAVAGSIAGLKVGILIMRRMGKPNVGEAEAKIEELTASLKNMCPE